MRQVILNLLGNAVKFTEQGSVAIEVLAATCPSGSRVLQISVADTGVGIAEARQQSVFEEFVQADASITRRFGGSGLGLNISRRLVELMGGALALTSEEGRGTRVTMTLPLVAAEHAVADAHDLEFAAHPTGPFPPAEHEARILLVEDLDINRELISEMLTRLGYRVETASDGEEAIQLASQLVRHPEKYHLIFMDVQMPIVDGLSATRAIRALEGRAREIPIIGLTANAFAADVEQCLDAGMDAHLAKPVSMAALAATLGSWLRKGECTNKSTGDTAGAQGSLEAKFTERMVTYADRLCEIQLALARCGEEGPAALLSDAEAMAHNLAGTAGMFGRGSLGDLAAEVSASLRQWPEVDDGALDLHIGKLATALRQAA